MNWKFSCETKETIPLPPEYTFPQAFNYLNPEVNSFYILENERGYIQYAGEKKKCTVEIRELGKDGTFKHYVFFDPNGSNEYTHIPMTNGGVERQVKHCFGYLTASKLFLCFFEGKNWPAEFQREDITSQFI